MVRLAREIRLSRMYRKSPIIEVVCELIFTETSPWNADTPLAFFEQVKESYPRFAPEARINFQIEPTDSGTDTGAAKFQVDPLMLFTHNDGAASVQLSRRLLAINRFAPYPSWSTLQPMIAQVVDAYRAVGKPDGIDRIGLRYINRIVLPSASAGLRTYLTVYPNMDWQLGRTPGETQLRMVFPYGDDTLTLGLIEQGAAANPTLILDLDYVSRTANVVSLDTAMDWVGTAHDAIEQMFEASVTDALRLLMEEVTP